MSIWPAALFAIILLLFGGGAKGAETHSAPAVHAAGMQPQ